MNQHLRNAKVLRQAKVNLIEDGWVRGNLGSPGRPSCVLGAIGKVAEYEDGVWEEFNIFTSIPAAKALARCVSPEYPTQTHLIYWNDQRARSKQEVLDTLEKCAQREEELGRDE